MEDKILKLTQLWYEYVGMDHHKDRDCHWYIIKVWSHGDEPYYCIDHSGYIFSATSSNRHYKTYEAAEKALYWQIEKAFRLELEWAELVVSRTEEYNEIQIRKAGWLIKTYKGE